MENYIFHCELLHNFFVSCVQCAHNSFFPFIAFWFLSKSEMEKAPKRSALNFLRYLFNEKREITQKHNNLKRLKRMYKRMNIFAKTKRFLFRFFGVCWIHFALQLGRDPFNNESVYVYSCFYLLLLFLPVTRNRLDYFIS